MYGQGIHFVVTDSLAPSSGGNQKLHLLSEPQTLEKCKQTTAPPVSEPPTFTVDMFVPLPACVCEEWEPLSLSLSVYSHQSVTHREEMTVLMKILYVCKEITLYEKR